MSAISPNMPVPLQFLLRRPPWESEWGSGLQAAEDFDMLQALLQPKNRLVPQDVVQQAKQLVDFSIQRLYPAFHALAFGDSGTQACFGPHGLHPITKSISRLLCTFHTAIPHRTSSVLPLSAIIKHFHARVKEFCSAVPRSSWDPFPFQRLQALLDNEESMHYIPMVRVLIRFMFIPVDVIRISIRPRASRLGLSLSLTEQTCQASKTFARGLSLTTAHLTIQRFSQLRLLLLAPAGSTVYSTKPSTLSSTLLSLLMKKSACPM